MGNRSSTRRHTVARASDLHDPATDLRGADEAADELVGHHQAPLLESFSTPEKALKRLQAGNERFARATAAAATEVGRGNTKARAEQLKLERDYLRILARGSNEATRLSLEKSQAPYAAVITCSDSRVAPSLLFDAGLGSLFVIRNAGGVTDDMTLASVEYAVNNLGVKLVVVMGHESCGAITAAVQAVQREDVEAASGLGATHATSVGGAPLPTHTTPAVASAGTNALLNALRPAARAAVKSTAARAGHGTHADVVSCAVELSVHMQLLKLVRGSSSLQHAIANRRVKVVAGLYRFRTGTVSWLKTPPGATAETVSSDAAVGTAVAAAAGPTGADGSLAHSPIDLAAAHMPPTLGDHASDMARHEAYVSGRSAGARPSSGASSISAR